MSNTNEPKKMVESLNDDELEQVNGGIMEGDSYSIGKYICPFCGEEHEVRFRPNILGLSEIITPKALPCGKGQLDRVIIEGTIMKVKLTGNGETLFAEITTVGNGWYNENEVYF